MRRAYSFAVIAVFFMLMTSCFIELGRATTSRHQNSLGVVTYESNPLVYVAGNISDATKLEDGINLHFQPLATYALFDQNILLCGTSIVHQFDGKRNPMVLTYERQAHRSIEGVGCHNLIRVDNLETSKELQ